MGRGPIEVESSDKEKKAIEEDMDEEGFAQGGG